MYLMVVFIILFSFKVFTYSCGFSKIVSLPFNSIVGFKKFSYGNSSFPTGSCPLVMMASPLQPIRRGKGDNHPNGHLFFFQITRYSVWRVKYYSERVGRDKVCR